MPSNPEAEVDFLRISVPGPITVDILGTETIEFNAPTLRLTGVESLHPDERNILLVMLKLIAEM
ncbi:hypothetical protein JZ785_06745 [Alicyclobacillus curvatus]|jgi:hypothetical protein|nr:hypothetical protein JZ785_06745 [Alicyclobacillus curvatus]